MGKLLQGWMLSMSNWWWWGGVGQGYASLAASNAASQFLVLMIALGSLWLLVSCGPADAEFGAFLEPAPSCRAGE